MSTEEEGIENVRFWAPAVELTRVDEGERMWSLESHGMGFGLLKEYGVTPEIGDLVRTASCKPGIGYEIVGMRIKKPKGDWITIYDKTDEEIKREKEAWALAHEESKRLRFQEMRAKLDADYSSLPVLFQKRIERFREGSRRDVWRVEYEEYEMMCCVDAVKIADKAATMDNPEEWVRMFSDLPYDRQKTVVEMSQGHSGNSFTVACRLAYHAVTRPNLVILAHGALTPLVGCERYGCDHDDMN